MIRKFFVLTLVCSSLFFSCKKEEPVVEEEKDCNCGTIANDGIDSATNCYWLEIRNECSGNKKKWCFDEDVWMNANVGERFCVSNVAPW